MKKGHRIFNIYCNKTQAQAQEQAQDANTAPRDHVVIVLVGDLRNHHPLKALPPRHSLNHHQPPLLLLLGLAMDELRELVVQTGAVAQPEAAANAEPPRLELTVEEIIEEHVGSLGFAQLLHVFFVSIAWVFDAQSTLVTIFSDAQPAWRCKASSSSLPACSATSSAGMCGLDREAWEWVAGSKSSIIAEWDLVCGKRFQAGIPASLFFLGSLLGKIVDFPVKKKKKKILVL